MPLPGQEGLEEFIDNLDPETKEALATFHVITTDLWVRDDAEARFDYEMPSRYGVDWNQNGIIDLPNSRDYVLNRTTWNTSVGCGCLSSDPTTCAREPARFRVRFDASQSETGIWRNEEKPQELINDEIRRALRLPAGARVPLPFNELTQTGAPYRLVKAPRPIGGTAGDFDWTIQEQSGRQVAATGPRPMICLEEGAHDVTLTVGRDTLNRRIVVEDHLIVVLGDSFAAGEGAPEGVILPFDHQWIGPDGNDITLDAAESTVAHKFLLEQPALWADPGGPPPVRIGRREQLFRPSLILDGPPILSKTIFEPDWEAMAAAGTNDTFFAHLQGHRSSFTHASQFAIELERASPRSSVTFINLAQTGATIDTGILGPYSGTDKVARFVDLNTSQRQSLEALLGPADGAPGTQAARAADALYMSIGGNDAGFANIIAALFAAWETISNDLIQIQDAFHDGNWNSVKHLDPFFSQALEDAGALPGLEDLPARYDALGAVIDRWRVDGYLDGPAHLIAPPFFGTARLDAVPNAPFTRRSGVGDLGYCEVTTADARVVGPITIPVDISPLSMRWADRNVHSLMIKVMSEAAARQGWVFVNQGDTPRAHGLCAATPAGFSRADYAPTHLVQIDPAPASGVPVRWYNGPYDSEVLQRGNAIENEGQFHPNIYGYAWVRELLKAASPRFETEFSGAWYTDPDDSFDGAGGFTQSPGVHEVFRLDPGSLDVDILRVLASKGESVSFRLRRLDERLAVTIFAENGQPLVSTAQWPGTVQMPGPIVSATAPRTGRYYVAVHDAENVQFDPVTGQGDSVRADAPASYAVPRRAHLVRQ
ncbi:MAG: hypothetical protein AAGA15_05935 [Pseudomonadota bacterium]